MTHAGSRLPAGNLHPTDGRHKARGQAGTRGALEPARVRPPAGSLTPVGSARVAHGNTRSTRPCKAIRRLHVMAAAHGLRGEPGSKRKVGPQVSWGRGVPTPRCLHLRGSKATTQLIGQQGGRARGAWVPAPGCLARRAHRARPVLTSHRFWGPLPGCLTIS